MKLRGALCKMNPILRSLRLSMGGVDPLIDDHTLLFFARVSTGPSPRCEDFGAVAGH